MSTSRRRDRRGSGRYGPVARKGRDRSRPGKDLWEAEHQDYLERRPNGYTCHYFRPDGYFLKRTRNGKSGVHRLPRRHGRYLKEIGR